MVLTRSMTASAHLQQQSVTKRIVTEETLQTQWSSPEEWREDVSSLIIKMEYAHSRTDRIQQFIRVYERLSEEDSQMYMSLYPRLEKSIKECFVRNYNEIEPKYQKKMEKYKNKFWM